VGAAGMIGLQLAITYVPLLNRLLHTAPLPADSWLWIVAVAFVAYAVVGIEKSIRRGWSGAAGDIELSPDPKSQLPRRGS